MAPYRWVQVTGQAAFAPRDGAGAVVLNDAMWLLGGWNPRDKTHFPLVCNNEVWRSQDGAEWTLEKPNTFLPDTFDADLDWEGRHTSGYVVHDNRMWIVGGDPIQGHYQNDVWASANGKDWRCVCHDAPWGPRVLHYTVAFDGRIWVMGGQTLPQFAPADTRFCNDVWSSGDGAHWERHVEHAPWKARGMIGGSAVLNGRIWLLGGGTYDTPDTPARSFRNDVWSTADGVHWEQHVEHAPWPARQYHEVAVFDERLWVLEGWNQTNRNDVWYSSDGVQWHELPGTPWAPRHAASVFVFNGALWIVAGNNMESDVWRLERTGAPASIRRNGRG